MHVNGYLLTGWLSAIALVLLAGLAARFLRRRVRSLDERIVVIGGETNHELSADSARFQGWWIVGFLILVASFAALEIRQPFYFAQDDALMAELPGMVAGCQSIWHGVWPDYEPFRAMGGPLAAEGVYSLTYPPTYLAYAISHHLLRNDYTLLDVFAALHLLAGYAITFGVCHRLGFRPPIACIATLSFLLSGSVLVMGRSWHAFVPIVVWLPLLAWAVHRWIRGPVGWRWVVGTGVATAMFYHVGFPQLWADTLLLLAVGAVLRRSWSWRAMVSLLAAGSLAVALICPLLIPQFLMTRGLTRPAEYGDGVTWHWIAAFLPYPLIVVPHPMGWGSSDVRYMGHFIYFGTTFAVLFVAALGVLLATRFSAWLANRWLLSAVVAVLLSMGPAGGLYELISHLPGLRTINNDPFRAMPIAIFFAIVGSGVMLERWMRHSRKFAAFATPLAILTLALLAEHVYMARPSFYTYSFRPYPPLTQPVAKRLADDSGRIASWVPDRSPLPMFATAIPLNLPLVYGIPTFNAYDPLLQYGRAYRGAIEHLNHDPAATFRAYGVRWHLVSILMAEPVFSENPGQRIQESHTPNAEAFAVIRSQLTRVVNHPDVKLEALADVAPMAFAMSRPSRSLPLQFEHDALQIDLKPVAAHPRTIVANFLWWPRTRATIDGEAVACHEDEWGRISLNVPARATLLSITYSGGWLYGLAVGLFPAATAGLLICWLNISKARQQEP